VEAEEVPDALWPVGALPCGAPRSTLDLEAPFSPFAPRANTLFSFSISATSSRGELTTHLHGKDYLRDCEIEDHGTHARQHYSEWIRTSAVERPGPRPSANLYPIEVQIFSPTQHITAADKQTSSA
jgi:hypothetical protein